jgi:HD-GYP domain-containing protein (c-di-GMP phosphodiesterase class II)
LLRRTVEPVASSQEFRNILAGIEVSCDGGPLSMGPTGQAALNGVPTFELATGAGPQSAPWRSESPSIGFRSTAGLPVFVKGELDGVLTLYGAELHAFDPDAVADLEELARTIGYGLERLRDCHELHQAFVSSIDLVTAVVESRDPYTAGHQALVAELARAIGEDLGLDEHHLNGLQFGARIHDVGKVGVPIDILSRPGKLAEEEMAMVRRHATIGWEIAGHFTWPWPVAEIVHQHHERFDGTGYPQGLHGEEILLEARIVSVADVYQATASRRPYREVLGVARAFAVVVNGAGTQFDPDVVAAFVRVIEGGFEFSTAEFPPN